MITLKSLSILVGVLFFTACATSPTGRSQLLIFPEGQMNQMGVAAFSDMKKKSKVVGSKVTDSYVNCVANAIIDVLPNNSQQTWEVVVFDDDSVNAFALPGGKIGVHTGLLTVATNQDQLAAVIGHEVGHVLAQHGNERMSISFASQTGQQLMGAMLENNQQKSLIMGAMGLGMQFGVQLPYSRSHESEADIMGLDFMARAGFDPRESVQLWKNMSKQSKEAPAELLSTHPSNVTRINDLQSNMSSAMQKYTLAKQQGKAPRCK